MKEGVYRLNGRERDGGVWGGSGLAGGYGNEKKKDFKETISKIW